MREEGSAEFELAAELLNLRLRDRTDLVKFHFQILTGHDNES